MGQKSKSRLTWVDYIFLRVESILSISFWSNLFVEGQICFLMVKSIFVEGQIYFSEGQIYFSMFLLLNILECEQSSFRNHARGMAWIYFGLTSRMRPLAQPIRLLVRNCCLIKRATSGAPLQIQKADVQNVSNPPGAPS